MCVRVVGACFSLSGKGRAVRRGGRLFEAGLLLTFSASRMGAYSRWALIRGWALIRINTVFFSVLRVFFVHSPLPIPMIVATANEKN